MMFKIRISHTTHASLASNINLTRHLYLDPPNVKFVLDYSYMYGGIKAAGVKQLVTWDITTIITGAQIVMIKDDIIYEVTKTKYLKECVPKTDIMRNEDKNKNKNKRILTKQGVITINIPPPPLTPPPRLPYEHRIQRDRLSQIDRRPGQTYLRFQSGNTNSLHNGGKETSV
jgi:hypothetical protein